MSIPYSTYFKPIHIFLATGAFIGLVSLAFSTGAIACNGGGGGGGSIENLWERMQQNKQYRKRKNTRRIYRSKRNVRRIKSRRVRRAPAGLYAPRTLGGIAAGAIMPSQPVPVMGAMGAPPSLVRLPPEELARNEARRAKRNQAIYEQRRLIREFGERLDAKNRKILVNNPRWGFKNTPPPGTPVIGQGRWTGPLDPTPSISSIPTRMPGLSSWDPVPGGDYSGAMGPLNNLFGHAGNATGVLPDGVGSLHSLLTIANNSDNPRAVMRTLGAAGGAKLGEALAIAFGPTTGGGSVVAAPVVSFIFSVAGDAIGGGVYDVFNTTDQEKTDMKNYTQQHMDTAGEP